MIATCKASFVSSQEHALTILAFPYHPGHYFPTLLCEFTFLNSLHECIITEMEGPIMLLWLLQTKQAQLM